MLMFLSILDMYYILDVLTNKLDFLSDNFNSFYIKIQFTIETEAVNSMNYN